MFFIVSVGETNEILVEQDILPLLGAVFHRHILGVAKPGSQCVAQIIEPLHVMIAADQ